MNYTEAVEYIEEIPKFTTKNPPGHTRELLRRLGDPDMGMKIIHVAGTNGKGSVCAYLDAMFREGGYSCGLFTSPHLIRINERYMINHAPVDDDLFLESFLRVREAVESLMEEGGVHPSYFELLFLMGMYIFRKTQVEYVILETGLGGRLDATNVVDRPLACIITSISRDHTEYLGETIPEIAGEKAGIIKPGIPVFYDGCSQEAAEVIGRRARELKSPSYELLPSMYCLKSNTREGISFEFRFGREEPETLAISYIAAYQMMNASLAYLAMRCLFGIHKISKERLVKGIAASKCPCRMETVLPGVVIDGAHNEDGVAQFVKTAVHFRPDRITILFSAVCDKRYKDMVREIVEGIRPDAVVVTEVPGGRMVTVEELAQIFRMFGCRSVAEESDVGRAFETACEAKGEGMLFCVGSLYLAGELKDYINNRRLHD